MYQPSDILLIPYPFTDLSNTKKRPVLVLTHHDTRGDFLVAQITSKSGYDHAITIQQPDLAEGNLPKLSFVRSNKIMTLNSTLVLGRFGRLDRPKFLEITQQVCSYLACKQ